MFSPKLKWKKSLIFQCPTNCLFVLIKIKMKKNPWFFNAQQVYETYQFLHWDLFSYFFIWGILNSPKLKIPYVCKLLHQRILPVKLIFITSVETAKWNWIKGTAQTNIKEYRIFSCSSTQHFTKSDSIEDWNEMEQSKYLLKFQRSEQNSVPLPRHKYFVKIGTDRLERQGIPQDLLTVTYTFNCSIYFILDSPS